MRALALLGSVAAALVAAVNAAVIPGGAMLAGNRPAPDGLANVGVMSGLGGLERRQLAGTKTAKAAKATAKAAAKKQPAKKQPAKKQPAKKTPTLAKNAAPAPPPPPPPPPRKPTAPWVAPYQGIWSTMPTSWCSEVLWVQKDEWGNIFCEANDMGTGCNWRSRDHIPNPPQNPNWFKIDLNWIKGADWVMLVYYDLNQDSCGPYCPLREKDSLLYDAPGAGC